MQEKVDTIQENKKESLDDSYAILKSVHFIFFFFLFFLNFILFLNFTSVHFKTGRKGLSFVFQEVIRWGFPGEAVGKNPPASSRDAGDASLILGSGRSPGVGNSSPLQCSCLENFMGGGAW